LREFIENISKLEWWLSIFFIGIFINILSAFVKHFIDKLISKYSEKYRQKVELKKRETEEKINEMIKDRTLAIEKKIDLVNIKLLMVTFLGLMFSIDFLITEEMLLIEYWLLIYDILFITIWISLMGSVYHFVKSFRFIHKYEKRLREIKKSHNKQKTLL